MPRRARQAGEEDLLDLGAAVSHSATACALEKWRSMRKRQRLDALQVKKALNGEIAAPMSRSICTRTLRMNEPGPSAGQ